MSDPNIISRTTHDNAPDRCETETIGGVQCHYALKGNLNEGHPEQQDRAAAYALPGVGPDQFQQIMTDTFANMQAMHRGMKSANPDFAGDGCATIAMMDPQTGRLAIGSKGDAAAYMVLQHKSDPQKVIIERISSPYEKLAEVPEAHGGARVQVNFRTGPNTVGRSGPVMWAHTPSDYDKYASTGMFMSDGGKAPAFELLDLRDVVSDVLRLHHEKTAPPTSRLVKFITRSVRKQDRPEDYTVSIIVASDGITGGIESGEQAKKDRLQTIASAIAGSSPNKAQALLDAVSMPKSYDNLSAVIFHDITLGRGESVAAAIVDGNHNGNMKRVHDGSVAAQGMMECFERAMRETQRQAASEQAAGTEHRERITQTFVSGSFGRHAAAGRVRH